MPNPQDISNWLSTKAKERNAHGFVIDYTDPSPAAALAIYCANLTKRECVVAYTPEVELDWGGERLLLKAGDSWAKAAELSRMANHLCSLIIQPYDICEINIIRPWERNCLVADLLPFAKMYRRDINGLYASIADLETDINKKLFEKEARLFYSEAVKVSFDELDWAYRIDQEPMYKGVVSTIEDPSKHPKWGLWMIRQKQIISFLNQRKKKTNHLLELPNEL
jgi:hypothetical protein